MAYTKAQLEELIGTLLASGQPIEASQHRAQILSIVDEIFSAQSRGNVIAGVTSSGVLEPTDTILIFRGGLARQIPASLFSASTLAGLSDVFILDPEEGEILIYNLAEGRWENKPLTGLFVTQDQLAAALAALNLPTGARVLSYDLVISSPTAGTLDASWVDFEEDLEGVTAEPLTFNTAPDQELPAPGNFRFDLIQGFDDGTVTVKQGTEANAGAVAPPSADAGALGIVLVLWNSDGEGEVTPPVITDPNQNAWSLARFSTGIAPGTNGKWAKIWEGNLSAIDNFGLIIDYHGPKELTTGAGSGAGRLTASWTCDGALAIAPETVQLETEAGTLPGEFRLVEIAGNRAALYYKLVRLCKRRRLRYRTHRGPDL
jgi:hypothetical protein